MNTIRAHKLTCLTLILIGLFSSGCGNSHGSAEAYYKFPLIPVKIAYDLVSKSIKVSIHGEIQTPLGTFGISAGAGSSYKRFEGVRTLIIDAGGSKYFYQLEKGRQYSISLPSDENGEAKVIFSGLDENISIVVPNPTNEKISDLREQLRHEQEARSREREEAEARERESLDAEGVAEEQVENSGESEAQKQYELELRARETEQQRQRELALQEKAEQQRLQAEYERQRREEAERRAQEAEQRGQAEAERRRQEEARRDEIRRQRKAETTREVLNIANKVIDEVRRRRRN